MILSEMQFRVRYAETDQMGVAYHGNYAQYIEMGRTEWLRNLGFSYKKLEEFGVMLPLINLNINYLKPAKYDDLLTLKTTLLKRPSARIEFGYELFNENQELLTTGQTTLVFVNMKTNKPIRIPEFLLKIIDQTIATSS
ncbi:thioesterase family protein [Lutibacter sp.]|uniref:acyl-CoA thioesterase n=1 Tax=Lutibacter sp. TaxID=1925666 RepID=UPI00273619CC|nr:thioesterase family protein [Lutibacter sp.]MDP3312972.1 thioesterase family protein [Lutibacter sp.]